MTDPAAASGAEWLPRLREVIRGSAHETRNSLNGLVVNLEVVRSRLARLERDGSEAILSFAEQAVAQGEQTVRLTEAAAALLALIAASIDADGLLRCSSSKNGSELYFAIDRSAGERVMPGLRTLGKAVGFGADMRDGTVILSFPPTAPQN